MSIDDPASWIRLDSPQLHACIDPVGAQLVVLRDGRGRDLLWDGDARWWNGRAPVLFPIVGALANGRYRWQGHDHALPRHGFARGMDFDVEHTSDDDTVLLLKANEATRSVYPFEFELRLRFTITHATLRVVATARNVGTAAMPASLGFHPAFRWPLDGHPRTAHWIEFEKPEPASVRRLGPTGLLEAAAVSSPVEGRRLDLHDALFDEDVLIFDQLQSRVLSYGSESTRLEVGFPDARYLGLWTKPGAGFLCIEPWRGIADPEGFDGEFSDKPGVSVIAPGGELALTMTVRLP